MKPFRSTGKECSSTKRSIECDPHATLATLAMLGVPRRTLDRADSGEWRVLQADLDRFFAFGYGDVTQQTFLHSPHPCLAWETPAQALGRDDGILAVREALKSTLHALRAG